MIDITEEKRTERRLLLQYAVTSILAEADSVDQASIDILDVVGKELGWQVAQLWVPDPDGNSIRLRHSTLIGSFTAPLFQEDSRRSAFGPGVGIPGQVWAKGQPYWSADLAADKNFPRAASALADGLQSGFGFPITFGERVLAVMEFFSVDRVEPDEDLLRVFAALGRQIGQVIERTRVEEVLRAGANRQRFLSQAGAVLASSLDYDTVLHRLAEMIVGELADWCAIDMLNDGDGSIERIVLAHADPSKRDTARDLERYEPDPARAKAALEVLMRGDGLLFAELTDDEQIGESALDPRHSPILRDLGIRSCMIIPLIARGRMLGAITFIYTDSGRRYAEADLEFGKDLAYRAALAVDNARLYGESQRIQEELRKANETKDEFLGLVSHELRTPITTIYGGARLLRERQDSLDEASKQEVLLDIAGETERLHRIVEDLLVLARAEFGQEMTWDPVSLGRIVESSVRLFHERHPNRPLTSDISPDLAPVTGEITYIEQVLRNLLSNAEKYTPAGGQIGVVAEAGAGEAIVRVLDTGPGIEGHETEDIFERFYRSPRHRGKAAGIGLGLTVCKRLIEAQGGRVWAKVRERGGLEVGFALPYYAEA